MLRCAPKLHEQCQETRGNKVNCGAPGRNRTHNPRLRRPMLYPIELRAQREYATKKWSEQRDSNSRPPAPKAGALPNCAMLRILISLVYANSLLALLRSNTA